MSTARPRDEVIERVRKLLERQVGKGCTEAEAATAYQMASRIMAEHNLGMAEIEASQTEEAEDWVTETVWEDNTRYNAVLQETINTAQSYFFVRAVFFRGRRNGKVTFRLQFFGKPSNVETAKWVFTSMIGLYDALWLKFRMNNGPGYGKKDKTTFILGVIRGFRQKLARERRDLGQERDVAQSKASGSTGTELATIDKSVQSAFELAHSNATTYKGDLSVGSRDATAFNAGFREGLHLNLAKPVGGESKPKGSIGSS